MCWKRLYLVLILALGYQANAMAQTGPISFPNYQSYVLGLRTAGMGGAAVAFGHDSAMPWLNPSGLVRASSDTFALSANAYVVEQWSGAGFLSADSGERANLSGNEVSTFPTSLSYLWHVDEAGNYLLAFSVLVPYRSLRDFEAKLPVDRPTAVGRLLYSEAFEMTQYELGPSYSMRWGPVLIGLSAFFRYVPIELSRMTDATGYDPNGEFSFQPSQLDLEASSFDMDFVAGAQIGPFLGGFNAGLAVHSPSVHLAGKFHQDGRDYYSDTWNDEVSCLRYKISQDSFEVRTPFWLSIGLAYEKEKSFSIAVDVSYHLPVSRYANISGIENIINVRNETGGPPAIDTRRLEIESSQQDVVNFNIGAEVYLTDRWIMRGGFYSDFAAIPKLSATLDENTVGRGVMNRFGGTLGIGYRGEKGQFQASFLYMRGAGDSVVKWIHMMDDGQIEPKLTTGELISNTFMFVFSGEINVASVYAAAKQAVTEEYERAND